MRNCFIIILLVIVAPFSFSQELSNLRNQKCSLNTDSILIDTLSIVPKSLIVYDENNKIITDSLYKIDYAKSLMILHPALKNKSESIRITYRVFPISFSQKYFHKDYSKIETKKGLPVQSYKYTPSLNRNNTLITNDNLDKRGSITRGVTFGNNQDASINSSLNLQLSGKLSDNINIIAAISDNNIPFQPEGNTQQIQEFDKVFIQLYNDKSSLTVGDFEIEKPEGYFMNLNKKAQGAIFSTEIKAKNKSAVIRTSSSGAVSKGKYNRMVFNGTEGNQGPYKLIGNENESYIIVLAGSEKIYVDGKLLKRGQSYDYIINYNTAEISFTANQLITKDKRIVVEFEYSDKNYARFLLYNSTEINTNKGKFWVNAFWEQDSKNQTLAQNLSNEQKEILSQVGDSLQNALALSADSIAFEDDMALYKKTDTLVNNTIYNNIYVYSTNPDSAFFRVGFSYVGENNGDYRLTQSAANGKVYEWVAPINDTKQGNFAPVKLLIAPQKKQLLSIGSQTKLSSSTTTFLELAVSQNDINTFSSKDNDDNTGYALKMDVEQHIPVGDTSNVLLTSSVGYLLIDKQFNPIERFKSVEFERDWNLATNSEQETEHLLNINLDYLNKKLGTAAFNTSLYNKKSGYNGIKNAFRSFLKKNGWEIDLNGSLLQSTDPLNKTIFLRHSAALIKNIAFFKLGIREETENNLWKNKQTDSLLNNSFMFSQYEIFLTNSDTSINQFFINYKNRKDFLPGNNQLKYSSMSEDFTAGIQFLKSRKNILKTSFTYRNLAIKDTLLSKNASENTILGRIEHSSSLFKRAISTSTFYEIGSGLEIKKEFSYLEVSQGQGIYSWNDYNENKIKELNEFEIANFQDEAHYIRIFTPSNDYIKVYSNQFNQTINLKPAAVWKKEEGIKKILSKFSNFFAYRINRKISEKNFALNANPFTTNIADSSLISTNTSLRNNISFNTPKLGTEFIFQRNKNRSLLANGFDTKKMTLNGIRNKWQINNPFRIINYFSWSSRSYNSQYFQFNNYDLSQIENEFSLSYQPGFNLQVIGKYNYKEKINQLASEASYEHKLGTELKYNILNKGNITVQSHYIHLNYTAELNTAIAYQMLEGLLPGNNATWEARFVRSLGKGLEINLNYAGRISEGNKAIHTGSMQVRAIF